MHRPTIAALSLCLALTGCAGSPTQAPATAPAASLSAASASAAQGASATPSATHTAFPSQTPTSGLVQWPDNTKVSHLFFHSLVVDPARAFDPKSPDSAGFEQYMVTIGEFKKILQSLYDKGYVLVHPQRLAAVDDSGVMRATPLYLPAGKKPLVLSVDDVSYNKPTQGAGFASNLTLSASGKVTNTYTDAAGKTTQGSYDVPPVLDDFVAAHPDFSYRGDKGTIALTGYEGVLGYRSSKFVYGDNDTTQEAIDKATSVATALKKEGWRFADHSYGHRNFTTSTLDVIKDDQKKWFDDVSPIVGPTDAFIFAFGADVADGNSHYSENNEKFAYLKSKGFDYFFPVDAGVPYWTQLDPGSFRQARINIDGITLSRAIDGRQKVLPTFFDARAVVDPKRPLPTPGA